VLWAVFRLGLYASKVWSAKASAGSILAFFLSAKSGAQLALAVVVAATILMGQRPKPPRSTLGAVVGGLIACLLLTPVAVWTYFQDEPLGIAVFRTGTLLSSVVLASLVLYKLRPAGNAPPT
jgi:hypothetical protein